MVIVSLLEGDQLDDPQRWCVHSTNLLSDPMRTLNSPHPMVPSRSVFESPTFPRGFWFQPRLNEGVSGTHRLLQISVFPEGFHQTFQAAACSPAGGFALQGNNCFFLQIFFSTSGMKVVLGSSFQFRWTSQEVKAPCRTVWRTTWFSRVLRIMFQNLQPKEKSQRTCFIPVADWTCPDTHFVYEWFVYTILPSIPANFAKLHVSLCDRPHWPSRGRAAIFGAARQRNVTLSVEQGTWRRGRVALKSQAPGGNGRW